MKTSLRIRLLCLLISNVLMAGLAQASEIEEALGTDLPQHQAPCPMLDYDALESAALICATQAEHAPQRRDKSKALYLSSPNMRIRFTHQGKPHPDTENSACDLLHESGHVHPGHR
ncbi:MAG: hypothetical protein LCH26_01790 [Proteobacteria bacterium]|nr:hypothetical protein [Pseudomonadota bacterium]